MNPRAGFALLAINLLSALLSCSSNTAPLPELTPPSWQDGETSVYTIRRNDTLLFRRTITISLDEEAGEPIVIITSVVQSESTDYYFFDSTSYALTRYTLKPLELYHTVASEISISEVEVIFYPDQIRVEKTTIDGASTITLKPLPGTYAIEMLPALLRAVPLEPALNFTINGLVPLELRTLPVQVKVLGTKMVTTPQGEILGREVETRTRNRTIRFVYELAEPRRLIAIRDLGNSTETVLEDFFIRELKTPLPTD
ncbi:MAG: hypothetical protein ACP5JB_05205 [candidate division WOR-3 bacterium]|jgi:hypothetical protein